MHIVLHYDGLLPAIEYGGTQRVVWALAKGLVEYGHKVSIICKEGSQCNFATIIASNNNLPLIQQLPESTEIVHFHGSLQAIEDIPYVITIHGNPSRDTKVDKNAIFVSENHASRYNSESFVLNGLLWSDYPALNFSAEKRHFHFLANADWKVKNVKGAIKAIEHAEEKLIVMGGNRFSFRMGLRFSTSLNTKFKGKVGNHVKAKVMNHSKGLIFPVLWDEPFGLAIIESLYYGLPVYGTPRGSLPELISSEYGFLSNSMEEIGENLSAWDTYDSEACHTYAQEHFNHQRLAEDYLEKYSIVMSGQALNPTLIE